MSSSTPDTNGTAPGQTGSKKQPERRDDHQGKNQEGPGPASAPPSKPGIMTKLGLDLPTMIMMVKGAIPPTVAISIYQATPVANYFGTLGYLIGIMSILSICILPRGKFLQNLVLNTLFACIGAALALLIMWSALQARLHTQISAVDPTTGAPTYNSSQSAVSAVWLFATIWFINVLRAKHPSLNLPVIVFSIFTSIACTYSPLMTSNAAFKSIIKQILVAMLSAFGLAAGCSLLIVPVPSRKVTYGQMKGMIMLLRGAVKQEKMYLQSLEREDMFAIPHDVSAAVDTKTKSSKKSNKKVSQQAQEPITMAEAKALKQTVAGIRELAGKLQADLAFAKRDFSWGKLEAADLTKIFSCLRSCLIPVVGMSTVIDIFQRVAEKREWITDEQTPAEVLAEKNEEKRIWNEVMKQLHEPFEMLSEVVNQGLEHAGLQLEILPRPKTGKKSKDGHANAAADVEAKGDLIQPGDPEFARTLEEKVKAIKDFKGKVLKVWASERGLITDEHSPETINAFSDDGLKHRRDQSQLFLLLYIERLMQETAETVQSFVAYADGKVTDGSMKKNHLIVPNYQRLKKWAVSVFGNQDASSDNAADIFDQSLNVVYVGDGFAAKKDPEHLPATNAYQRLGNGLRRLSGYFGSEQSLFGLRVACATMTIGIVNFLEPTQLFFQKQRLVWAMIIISISMTETSGQSIFGFLCRVFGTLAAMIVSLIAWYIVDEKTPGVLVFLFLFIVFGNYFFLKYPQFISASMVCIVTFTLVIGYELQVMKIGITVSESGGQPAYPIYELAPYRLATVAGGCLVAFIWTIFPSPITDRTWLRRDLAATMYLLAHYSSVINETLKSSLQNTGGDPEVKSTPAHKLAKARRQLFGKLLLLLPSLKQHANFQRFEPTIGGRFPREIYLDIIQRATRINSYLTLMSYTVTWTPDPSDQDRAWINALSDLLTNVTSTKDTIICTLALLSNSLQQGHPLPPNVPLPKPYELTQQLEHMTAEKGGKTPRGLLDARNMSENGYAEFAVLQVCSSLVCDDLEGLVKSVGQLVGVVDFSFRVEGSVGSLRTGMTTAVGTESEGDQKGKGKVD
ncbi:hypothetical protein BJ170DRAFT_391372 [Xylariales sp. AK1849]|nr:hypothetical protein BJ170DRAFT_391372 [Xylariales sp. AK1849]